jgi:hypothetical protein
LTEIIMAGHIPIESRLLVPRFIGLSNNSLLIMQKITSGPQNLLDRRITLTIGGPDLDELLALLLRMQEEKAEADTCAARRSARRRAEGEEE